MTAGIIIGNRPHLRRPQRKLNASIHSFIATLHQRAALHGLSHLDHPGGAALIRRCNEAGRPAIFYAHPWEFDPEQPRMPLSPIKRFRHYNNLDKTLARLDRLLGEFAWGPMGPWAESARARLSPARAA